MPCFTDLKLYGTDLQIYVPTLTVLTFLCSLLVCMQNPKVHNLSLFGVLIESSLGRGPTHRASHISIERFLGLLHI